MKGIINRFKQGQKYGFITGENGQNYFFHISACPVPEELEEGGEVTFSVGRGKRGGDAAVDVVPKGYEAAPRKEKKEEQKDTSEYLKIGNTLINPDDVEYYGISHEERYIGIADGKESDVTDRVRELVEKESLAAIRTELGLEKLFAKDTDYFYVIQTDGSQQRFWDGSGDYNIDDVLAAFDAKFQSTMYLC